MVTKMPAQSELDILSEEQEKNFMDFMNFTDEMYDLIQHEDTEPVIHTHCMDSMDIIGMNYRNFHGYISLIVCIAGILMNILIVMVLTRKEMLTPINRMLTALAITDVLVMIEYIPFTLHMYIFELPKEQQYSYAWAVFVLFHAHFTQILHTINIQLTISMSIWRYLALKSATKSSAFLTMARCNICILVAYICPMIICIPNYLSFSIYHRKRLYLKPPYNAIFETEEVVNLPNFLRLCEHMGDIVWSPIDCEDAVLKLDWYTVGLSRMAKANNDRLHRINFWIFSVCVKLIPCVLLTFFMCWLLKTLYDAKKRHKMLQQRKSTDFTAAPLCKRQDSQKLSQNNQRQQFMMLDPASALTTTDDDQNHISELTPSDDGRKSTSSSPPHAVLKHQQDSHNAFNGNISCSQMTLMTSAEPNNPQKSPLIKKSSKKMTKITSKNSFSDGKGNDNHVDNLNSTNQQTQLTRVNNCNKIAKTNGTAKKPGKKTDHTSGLLIAVLLLFLISEFPQGIMALLSGIYGAKFFRICYNTWAEIWDIIALINAAVNFIMYCFMSKQFRLQFHSIFMEKKWSSCCAKTAPSHL